MLWTKSGQPPTTSKLLKEPRKRKRGMMLITQIEVEVAAFTRQEETIESALRLFLQLVSRMDGTLCYHYYSLSVNHISTPRLWHGSQNFVNVVGILILQSARLQYKVPEQFLGAGAADLTEHKAANLASAATVTK